MIRKLQRLFWDVRLVWGNRKTLLHLLRAAQRYSIQPNSIGRVHYPEYHYVTVPAWVDGRLKMVTRRLDEVCMLYSREWVDVNPPLSVEDIRKVMNTGVPRHNFPTGDGE